MWNWKRICLSEFRGDSKEDEFLWFLELEETEGLKQYYELQFYRLSAKVLGA